MKDFYNTQCSSIIKKIDSYTQVADVLQEADSNSLVLFDVDETLIVPTSVTMRLSTKKQHEQWLEHLIGETFPSLPTPQEYFFDSWVYYFDAWAIAETPLVIEPSIVSTISLLQKRGIKVLAVTNLRTEATSHIPSLPAWRYAKLQQVGIDFNKLNIPDKVFTQLPEKNGTYPVLYHGIVATNYQSKGTVLGAFLDYIQWKPSEVIFFDDSLQRINQVAQEMCKRSIPFTGYHYRGSDHVPGMFDKDVATLQFKFLANHGIWLSDTQAHTMLKKATIKKLIPT